jgi:hypothetical protein
MIGPFDGEYRFLSNFYVPNNGVFFEGICYPTAEHAFQAAKTLDISKRIRMTTIGTAAEAKSFGKTLSLQKNWENIKLEIMRQIVLDKFSRNTSIGEKLIATGSERLAEINTWKDRFWGVYNGTGENHLGKILMSVRNILQKKGI